MTQFHYEARSGGGERLRGILEAGSKESAVAALLAQGLTPLRASDQPPRPDLRDRLREVLRVDRLSDTDLTSWTVEIATLLKSGFTLEQSLATTVELAERKGLKEMLTHVLEAVRKGRTFSAALAGHQDFFPEHYIGLVQAGEERGALDEALGRLGAELERRQKTREKIRSALIYPMLLLVMIAATLALVLTVVIPQFEPFFEDMGTSLPIATRIVLGLGKGVGTYWWVMVGIGLVAVFAVRWSLNQEASRQRFHGFLLKSPLLFGLPQKRAVDDFCNTLGTLLHAGVAVDQAMNSAAAAVRNEALKRAIHQAASRVSEGGRVSDQLASSGLFPPLAIRLLALGEKGGNLDDMALRVSALYSAQVETAIERALSILVPAVTILMGALVAAFIGSILAGLMSVTSFAS